jgi:hypothetical protein
MILLDTQANTSRVKVHLEHQVIGSGVKNGPPITLGRRCGLGKLHAAGIHAQAELDGKAVPTQAATQVVDKKRLLRAWQKPSNPVCPATKSQRNSEWTER